MLADDRNMAAEDDSVPLSWVVLFVLLTLGLTAAVILIAGTGSGATGLLLPLH